MDSLNANGRVNGNMRKLKNDQRGYIEVGGNCSSTIPVPKYIDLYQPLGKLRLNPDEIPKKYEFVKKPNSQIMLDNVEKGYKLKGLGGIPKGFLKGIQKMGTKYFYINSFDGKAIIETPGGWKALDLFYQNRPVTDVDEMIENLPAVRGTLQRFNAYKDLQKRAALETIKRHGVINHLENFGGPTRAPMEMYTELLDEHPEINPKQINLVIVDGDKNAKLEWEKLVQKEYPLPINMQFFVDHYFRAPEIFVNLGLGTAGINSSHGGKDYLDDQECVELTKEESKIQVPGDFSFGTNMNRLSDHWDWRAMLYMKGAGGWNGINERPPGRAGELARESGDYDAKSYIATPNGFYLYEDSTPLQRLFKRNVHEIVVAKKKPESPIELI
jgi:hypothetical protein